MYARFVKYAERFKNNHLKAYNITDKAQQRSLLLDSIGEAALDIFEQLSLTGTDLDGAVNALRDKIQGISEPAVQHTQISLHQTRKG